MSYHSEHFRRYINFEFLRTHYEEIIKTGFDFPRIFIASMNYGLRADREKLNQLIDTYYTFPQKEDEYYPILKLKEFTDIYPEFRDLIKICALEYQNSVALIFSKTPRYWGLRGDPYFWTYLEEKFLKYSVPFEDIDFFEDIIGKTYFDFTGQKIGEEDYIKEFAHGGMSSGTISKLWVDYIPLLKYRLIKLNNDYYLNHQENSKIIKSPAKIIKTTNKSLKEILVEYDKPMRLLGYEK